MSALAAAPQQRESETTSEPRSSKLISPQVLMAIKSLELRARIVVEGF